jgi:hypothetical protein
VRQGRRDGGRYLLLAKRLGEQHAVMAPRLLSGIAQIGEARCIDDAKAGPARDGHVGQDEAVYPGHHDIREEKRDGGIALEEEERVAGPRRRQGRIAGLDDHVYHQLAQSRVVIDDQNERWHGFSPYFSARNPCNYEMGN